MKGAFVLGALSLGALTALATDIVTKEAPDECLLAINLGRSARLDKRLPLVQKDAELAKEAKDGLDGITGVANQKCTDMTIPGLTGYELFGAWFDGDDVKCKEVVQRILNDFTAIAPVYPPPLANSAPWDSEAGVAASRMLSDAATRGGCAMTQGCKKNLLICRLQPTTPMGSSPFSEEFFTALQERSDRGVDISKLTASDLNTPPNSSTSGAQIQGWSFSLLAVALGALPLIG